MNWPLLIDEKTPEPVRAILRGAGQVMFCGNAVTGFLVLIGFYVSGIMTGIAATIGLICSTLTAHAFKFCLQDIKAGLYGFNGILVAVCLSVFIGHTPQLWLYIVIASILSSIVWAMMTRLLHICRLPAATSSFVLISWIFLLMMHASGNQPPAPIISITAQIGAIPIETWLTAMMRAISQILFSDDVLVGGLLLSGIALVSWRGAYMAIAGALIGVALPLGMGIDQKAIEAGLYGFNPVLTMIAVGWVFLESTPQTTVLAVIAGILAVIWQVVLSSLLMPIGIPVLASPFIFTLWMVLFAINKFRSGVSVAPS